jgi:hypothetical protein
MSQQWFPTFCALILLSAVVGCGDSGNAVVEDTRSPTEIEQQMKDYDEQMEQSTKSNTNS